MHQKINFCGSYECAKTPSSAEQLGVPYPWWWGNGPSQCSAGLLDPRFHDRQLHRPSCILLMSSVLVIEKLLPCRRLWLFSKSLPKNTAVGDLTCCMTMWAWDWWRWALGKAASWSCMLIGLREETAWRVLPEAMQAWLSAWSPYPRTGQSQHGLSWVWWWGTGFLDASLSPS